MSSSHFSTDEQSILDSFFGPPGLSEVEQRALKTLEDQKWDASFEEDANFLDTFHAELQKEWATALPIDEP